MPPSRQANFKQKNKKKKEKGVLCSICNGSGVITQPLVPAQAEPSIKINSDSGINSEISCPLGNIDPEVLKNIDIFGENQPKPVEEKPKTVEIEDEQPSSTVTEDKPPVPKEEPKEEVEDFIDLTMDYDDIESVKKQLAILKRQNFVMKKVIKKQNTKGLSITYPMPAVTGLALTNDEKFQEAIDIYTGLIMELSHFTSASLLIC